MSIITNSSISNINNNQYTGIEWNGEKITNKGNYKLNAKAEDKAGNVGEKGAKFELQVFNPGDVLIFKADYNTNTDADFSESDKKDYSGGKVTTSSNGIEGEALKTLISGDSHYARYRPDKNIDEKEGTIMMWVNPSWLTAEYKGQDQGRYLLSLYKNDTKKYGINFVVFKGSGTTAQIRGIEDVTNEFINMLSVDTNSNESERWYKNGSGKWTHLTLSWNSETGIIKIYIDGELRGKLEAEKWTPYNVGINSWMKIGGSNTGIFTEFQGYIDRLKIYSKPLTDKQIEKIYKEKSLK